MAFSFTLPELRAELRALGHDGLPDQLILSFLSQLHLPLPSPAPSSSSHSSPSDTEASTCSTHSLSCAYGSPKQCSYNGDAALAGTTSFALADCGPHEPSSTSSLPETIHSGEFGDGSSHIFPALRPGEGNGNTKRISSSESHVKNGKLPRSSVPVEHEERLNRQKAVNGTENRLNEDNAAKDVEFADVDVGERGHESPCYAGERLGYVGHAKPNMVLGFGRTECRTTSRSNHAKGTECDKHGNRDDLIEHYWISVGEEHMRAMHSKICKKEQLSVLTSHGDPDISIDECIESKNGCENLIDGCSESKNGCENLIAKVQRCEDELQHLTLSLQAQQFKKPWFLEAARKPRAYGKEKHNFCSKRVTSSVSEPEPASDPGLSNVKVCEKCCLPGQSSMVIWNNLETPDKPSGNPSLSSVENASECLQSANKLPTTSEERPEHDECNTMLSKPTVNLSVGELEEVSQIENTENKLLVDLCPDESNDPDHSVCSKSSSASYQHSGSSGDSRSNVSHQLSTRASSRKPKQHKKRGGKIDRVASNRFVL